VKTSLGIDLGSTYSCVIHYAANGTEVIVPNAEGGELTPSVVHIAANGDVTVGEAAKRLLTEDPDNVIVGIKRQMGRDFPLEYAGRTLTPEGVSALILGRLVADAAEALRVPSDDLQVVITVPAYFGVAEKEATAAAARIANIHCPELLAEPVAAAYAYGLGTDAGQTSLVFDLGGGTFDAAVVGVDRGKHRVWAVDGESRLGGLDWDRRLQELLWEEVAKLDDADDLRYEDDVIAAIESASEKIKRKLTGAVDVTERIRLRGRSIQLTLTRARFEEVTRDLMLRTIASSERAIAAATRAGAPAVSQVLLVGGATRMPMVRAVLAEHLDLPVRLVDPDRAVARGAAILAEQLLAKEEKRTITIGGVTSMAAGLSRITPVLPRAIGVITYTSRDSYREDPYIAHIVAANTQLPINRLQYDVATIVPNQERARIQLYEQGGNVASALVADNRLLVEGELAGIPRGPAGTRLSLHISISVDGRISFDATAGERAVPVTIEAFMHGVLDDTELEQQHQATRSLKMMR
jgi:molecular chaperone DnaK